MRKNEDWLRDLGSPGPAQERALAELRAILHSGLGRALSSWVKGRDFDALAEDFVQEALIKVLAGLHGFRGESRFTTWAFTIAVRIALTELRRKRWKDVSLEDSASLGEQRLAALEGAARPPRPGTPPFGEWLRTALREELTERQRSAFNAVILGGMPVEEAARRAGTTRNALYKMLHDVRLRLRRRMERDGLRVEDMTGGVNAG